MPQVSSPRKGTAPHAAWWQQREPVLALLLVVLAAAVAAQQPGFLSPQNLRDILQSAAPSLVAAAGMTALIVAGGIDISVGAVLAICAVIAGSLAKAGWPLPATAVAAIAAGALLGALNGFLVALLRIPPIVATLATMGGLRGALLWSTRGNWIRDLPPAYTELGRAVWLGVPATAWIAAAVALAVSLYLAGTRPGRQCYAVGSNPRAAELAGIRPERVLFRSFVLLGALVGLGALLYTVRFDFVQENPGQGFELLVITGVVVGGTDIFGGRGTVLGSALGVLLLAAIPSGLAFMQTITGLRAHWEPAVQGLLILVAVLWDSLARRPGAR